MKNKFDVDVCIIGGGLLGCMAARCLTQYQLNVLLIEKEDDVCKGISKANTAIIYPGYDNKPGTLKSRLCVKGNTEFPTLCEELGVSFSKCGSIMVCYGPNGAKVLEKKYNNGIKNQVTGLKLLSGEEVHALEPHLSPDIYMGLYSPDTATVNPWEVGIAAFENALDNGCEVRLCTQITGITKYENGFQLTLKNTSSKSSVEAKNLLTARCVINCGGLYADQIREMLFPPSIRIYPEKADYFVFDKTMEGFLSHIIFEEPEEKGKGLTLVPTINGNILAGPSAEGDCEREDFSTSASGLAFLIKHLQKVVPSLPVSSVIRNFASIRPNPFAVSFDERMNVIQDTKSIHSFVIDQPETHPGFISLIGIKTPGLTCCYELAKHVTQLLIEPLENPSLNPDFEPIRKSPVRLKQLSLPERNALIQRNPSYGNIICRCEQISEGEILDAISRGARTVDGVKRRCGTGMGTCQGSRCTYEIEQILSTQLK